MTFCFAWKNDKAVFLVADSAVTVFSEQSSVNEQCSSFGEPVVSNKNISIYDGALKILKIYANCAVAIAGDSDSAYNIYDFLYENYEEGINLNALISLMAKSNLPLEKGKSVSLIIARLENNKPELILWESEKSETIYSNQNYFHIGKTIYDFTGFAKTSVDMFRKPIKGVIFDNSRILNSVIAIYQALVIFCQTMQEGVGGLINGLMIDSEGVKWNSDTEYMLYEHGMKNNNWITVGERDEGICLFSNITKKKFTIFNSTTAGSGLES
ncbi:MAG: hypothetical protein HND53_02060 [Proteobacteria bacterium]|nr:hypothetical protein [Pseudomonadota bacterium]NOG59255.1 hypothetical protein [Pseudomonadota bacterium]